MTPPFDGIMAEVAASKTPGLDLRVGTGDPPKRVQRAQHRHPEPTPNARRSAVRDLQRQVDHLVKWANRFQPLSEAQEHAVVLAYAALEYLGDLRPETAEDVEKAYRVLGGGTANDGDGVTIKRIAAETDRACAWWDSEAMRGRGDDTRGHLLLQQLAKVEKTFAPVKDLRAQRAREYAIAVQVRRILAGELQMSGFVTDLLIEYGAASTSRRASRASVQNRVDRHLSHLRKKASTRRVE